MHTHLIVDLLVQDPTSSVQLRRRSPHGHAHEPLFSMQSAQVAMLRPVCQQGYCETGSNNSPLNYTQHTAGNVAPTEPLLGAPQGATSRTGTPS